MRLERVSVQAFRGFPSRIEISLAGDVILICGDNGSGKTSLTEALEWALFGTVVRKTRSKSPSEFRGWEWLRSAHADPSDPTFVDVTLRRDDESLVSIRRELQGSTVVFSIDGRMSTHIGEIGMRREDVFRPFLGQSEIQAVIDSEQQDRWQQLSAILGFGEFGALRLRLQRLRTDTDHQPSVVGVREVAVRAVQPLTPSGDDPLGLDPTDLKDRAIKFLGLGTKATWAEIGRSAGQAMSDIYARSLRPPGLDSLVASREDEASSQQPVADLVRQVLGEAAEHREWHRENTLAGFSSIGLSLVDEDHPDLCPFCLTATLTPARRGALEAAAAAAPARPPDHRAELRERVTVIASKPGPIDLGIAARLLDSLGEGAEREYLARLTAEQAEIARLGRQLSGLLEGFLGATTKAQAPEGDAESLKALSEQLIQTAGLLLTQRAGTRASGDALVADLFGRLSSMSDDDRKLLSRLQAAQTLAENARSVEAAWKVRALQAGLEALVRFLEEAEKSLMTDALRTLSTDIGRYYEALSPGHHIKVSGVTVRDTRHRQASLNATSFGKAVNPVTTFSEAEGNCLGLSLYFSQRVDRNPGWSTILLDDPVQSMDEGHEQGLVHLLTSVGRDRQVIVLTHNKRFAEAIDAQFGAVRSFTRYNLEQSDSPQPRIEVAAGRLDELLEFAEDNAGGDRIVRESCATAIRKSVERFSRDVAATRNVSLPRRANPESLVDRIHAQGLIDDIEVGTLHRLRRFGSRGAHEDADVNASDTAIRTNARAMRELQSKHLGASAQLRVVKGGRAG